MKSSWLDVRGLRFHIQEWGQESNPTLLLLHGWMDCGATFRYVAEQLQSSFHIVAPDLRGFGRTEHAQGYWFPDYFADLDAIIEQFSPNHPAQLIGHSMGGNIALMYAGIQPDKVGRVLSLEALGMAPTQPKEAPVRYRRWMSEILSGEPTKIYPNIRALKDSIRKGNPRLSENVIEELVGHWAEPQGDQGAYRLKHDHNHRYTNPIRYQFDDVLEIWGQVTARVGIVMAAQSDVFRGLNKLGRVAQAQEVLRVAETDYYLLQDCGHMLHLEQPQATARCVHEFFGVNSF